MPLQTLIARPNASGKILAPPEVKQEPRQEIEGKGKKIYPFTYQIEVLFEASSERKVGEGSDQPKEPQFGKSLQAI